MNGTSLHKIKTMQRRCPCVRINNLKHIKSSSKNQNTGYGFEQVPKLRKEHKLIYSWFRKKVLAAPPNVLLLGLLKVIRFI